MYFYISHYWIPQTGLPFTPPYTNITDVPHHSWFSWLIGILSGIFMLCITSTLPKEHLPNSGFTLMAFDGLYLPRNFYIASAKVYLTFSHYLISLHFYNKMPEIGSFINSKINFSKWQRWRNSRSRGALTVSVVGETLLSLLSRCQAAGCCVIHRGKALSSCVIRHRRGTFAHLRPYIRHESIHDSKVFMAWWLHKSSLFNNTTLMMSLDF